LITRASQLKYVYQSYITILHVSTYHVCCLIYYTNELDQDVDEFEEEPAAEEAEYNGDTCLGKSSVEATMMMEGEIDEGEVLDKDHKVRIQLMEAEAEFRNECVR